PRLATAYVFENGQQIKAPYIDWSVAFSSGAVYSTVQDLWRWRGELLAGRVLGEKGAKEIFALRPFGYSFGWHVGRTNQARLRTFLASDYDAQPAPNNADLLLASHSGDLPGFHSCMTLFLDRTWTVILLDNHDSKSLPNLAAEIINALLTRTLEARSTSAPAFRKIDSEIGSFASRFSAKNAPKQRSVERRQMFISRDLLKPK
ncbi:MAG: hypothetical protein ACRD3W_23735, partial [Terriglobales bacterium]